jgi:hypothetical protein
LIAYVLLVMASVHEPKVLLPVAVLSVPLVLIEDSIKVPALLVNSRVVVRFVRAE